LQPARAALAANVGPFDNLNEDPNSQLIMMRDRAIDPHFAFLLLPLPAQGAAPVVTRTALPNGARLTVDWGSSLIDEIRMRLPYTPGGVAAEDPGVFPGNIVTDAEVSVVRSAGPTITGYTLVGATYLSAAGVTIAAVDDGPASLVFDGSSVHLGRPDADFRLLASMVSNVDYRDQPVPVHVQGNYLVRTVTTGAGGETPHRLNLRTYPNPFNPQVQISFVNPARGMVTATVHDIAGRRVATLVARVMEAGSRNLVWNGEDEAGNPSASGVYFLRLRAGALSATTKLVLVR
jgi:hypothetical protein